MKAFPASGNYTEEHNGMDLRDYFAAHIIGILLSSSYTITSNEAVSRAYEYADLMMKAREQ